MRAPRTGSIVFGREVEADEVPGPADQVVHLGEPLHEVDEAVGVELRDAAVKRGELIRFGIGGGDELLDARVAGRRQQRLEIPDDVVGGEIGGGHIASLFISGFGRYRSRRGASPMSGR